MKKMQSYRIDAETIKQIDEIGQFEKRTKSNVIEIAILRYYEYVQAIEEMARKYEIEQAKIQQTA